MINRFTWLAQCFEPISQMNDMSQAHQENHTSSQRPSSVAAAVPCQGARRQGKETRACPVSV